MRIYKYAYANIEIERERERDCVWKRNIANSSTFFYLTRIHFLLKKNRSLLSQEYIMHVCEK